MDFPFANNKGISVWVLKSDLRTVLYKYEKIRGT